MKAGVLTVVMLFASLLATTRSQAEKVRKSTEFKKKFYFLF